MIASTVETIVVIVIGLAFVAMLFTLTLFGIAEFKMDVESLSSGNGAESSL